MCGIAGLIDFGNNWEVDEYSLRQIAQALQFRGPDQEGYCFQNNPNFTFGLAHKRLSILDLSEAGKQPMWNSEKSSVITFNGEIYNFIEIREELKLLGFSFKTETDTRSTKPLKRANKTLSMERTLKLNVKTANGIPGTMYSSQNQSSDKLNC